MEMVQGGKTLDMMLTPRWHEESANSLKPMLPPWTEADTADAIARVADGPPPCPPFFSPPCYRSPTSTTILFYMRSRDNDIL